MRYFHTKNELNFSWAYKKIKVYCSRDCQQKKNTEKFKFIWEENRWEESWKNVENFRKFERKESEIYLRVSTLSMCQKKNRLENSEVSHSQREKDSRLCRTQLVGECRTVRIVSIEEKFYQRKYRRNENFVENSFRVIEFYVDFLFTVVDQITMKITKNSTRTTTIDDLSSHISH